MSQTYGQLVRQPLRRLLEGRGPVATAVVSDHLHYDRGARAWRTHEELAEMPRTWGLPARQDVELAGCA